MSNSVDPFALLERADKWYLGGGRATMYAPAFPRFLDTPGFWDEAYFADVRLERLYCLLLLDERARPLVLRRALRRWTPDRLQHLYTVEGQPHLRIQEERVVTPNDTFACRLTITNTGAQPFRLHLLLWSLQTSSDLPPDQFATTAEAVEREPDVLSFAHRVHYGQPGETPAEVYGWGERTKDEGGRRKDEEDRNSSFILHPSSLLFVALGGSRLPESWTVNLAETTDASPLWQTSLFPEKFQNGTLPREMQEKAGWNPNGMLHLAQHYVLEAEPGGTDALTVGANVALTREKALAQLRDDMTRDVIVDSRANWHWYFESVPSFTCDDPYLERYYWYRWYGLRLLTVDLEAEGARTGHLGHACVMEGIGAFRSHVSYSAQCHARETAWMRDPKFAMGSLRNFLDNQTDEDGHPDDGFLPGHLYLWRTARGFYHANWGAAALHVYYLTGNLDFVRQIYSGLARYAEYCDRERDREHSGLCDVRDQGETGQEYSSRYLLVEPEADTWRAFQIKGVDATCYLYELQRALAVFSLALGNGEEARWWEEKADVTRAAVRDFMWDKDAALFKDVNPQTWGLSPYKAAVGFYPFLSDIATGEHLPALNHLTNAATFGTPYPVPAGSVDDPYYNAQAEWKGKRTNCAWNGRVWPMTNAHVADALANAARTLDPTVKPLAAEFLRRFVRMMFHDGDPKRPNCYEHYNPETGMPSLYRGIDDYQHSWVVDLILRHVVGVQPEPGANGALVIDPLPFGLNYFRAEGIPIRGHLVDVIWDRIMGLTVRVDGQKVVESPDMQRIEIAV